MQRFDTPAFGQPEQETFVNYYVSPMQAAYELPLYEQMPYGPLAAQFPQEFMQQYRAAYPQNVPGYYF